jgi:hypothetical protein
VYLLTEGVQLTAGPYAKEVLEDPFDFYYVRGLLTPDMSLRGDQDEVEPFEGITKFFIGTKQYTFRYEPFPEQDFERLSRFGQENTTRVTRHVAQQKTTAYKTPLYVVAHGEKKLLSKEDYVGLMRRVGKQRGFAPLRSKVIVPRL